MTRRKWRVSEWQRWKPGEQCLRNSNGKLTSVWHASIIDDVSCAPIFLGIFAGAYDWF